MKRILILFLFVALVSSSYAQEVIGGRSSGGVGTLQLLLSDYGEKVGKRIEIVNGVHASIKFDVNNVSLSEYLKLIETKLAEQNIALYPISTNRLVATWIDPTKTTREPRDSVSAFPHSTTNKPAESYVERLRLRREAMKKAESDRIEEEAKRSIGKRPSGHPERLARYELDESGDGLGAFCQPTGGREFTSVMGCYCR